MLPNWINVEFFDNIESGDTSKSNPQSPSTCHAAKSDILWRMV